MIYIINLQRTWQFAPAGSSGSKGEAKVVKSLWEKQLEQVPSLLQHRSRTVRFLLGKGETAAVLAMQGNIILQILDSQLFPKNTSNQMPVVLSGICDQCIGSDQ